VIFLDSNVPMYLVGAEHRHKHDAQRLLDTAISRRRPLVTDAEVLQEILHRFSSIGRLEAIQPTLDLTLGLADEVAPVDEAIVVRAKDVLLGHPGLSARDAVHVAAMERLGVDSIMSFDADFDRVPGIDRLS
jgi:uncharacterized protein